MYEVDWLQEALDELTALWLDADSALRDALTDASHRVDQLLSQDPHGAGEARSGNQRIIFIDPLAVFYRIELDGQTVTVLHVCIYPERRA